MLVEMVRSGFRARRGVRFDARLAWHAACKLEDAAQRRAALS
jgi:hypothetical protein